MKEIAILIGTLIVHIFSSKGIALALFLILFWIKGRQLSGCGEDSAINKELHERTRKWKYFGL